MDDAPKGSLDIRFQLLELLYVTSQKKDMRIDVENARSGWGMRIIRIDIKVKYGRLR